MQRYGQHAYDAGKRSPAKHTCRWPETKPAAKVSACGIFLQINPNHQRRHTDHEQHDEQRHDEFEPGL